MGITFRLVQALKSWYIYSKRVYYEFFDKCLFQQASIWEWHFELGVSGRAFVFRQLLNRKIHRQNFQQCWIYGRNHSKCKELKHGHAYLKVVWIRVQHRPYLWISSFVWVTFSLNFLNLSLMLQKACIKCWWSCKIKDMAL